MTKILPFTLIFVVLTGIISPAASYYCVPGEECWPSEPEIAALRDKFAPTAFFTPGDLGYIIHQRVNTNTRVIKRPSFIALVQNQEEIRMCLSFIRAHRLRTSIVSSGHSFVGRNTADESFMINVHRMVNYDIDLNCQENPSGCITAEPGCQFGKLYEAVNRYDRLLAGGSDPTVSVSGWTLGGGHSPMTRELGLGVDNVVRMELVDAQGRFVTITDRMTTVEYTNGTISHSSSTDLFWAMRGGGGGTYGIMTSITYKLHKAPQEFVLTNCRIPAFESGLPGPLKRFFNWYTSFVQTLPATFGGYLIPSVSGTGKSEDSAILLSLLHHGNMSMANPYINEILGHMTKGGVPMCEVKNMSTFWDYQRHVVDVNYIATYLCGSFIQPTLIKDGAFTDAMVTAFNETFHSEGTLPNFSGTFIHIGGKSNTVHKTKSPVNEGFRTGVWSAGFGVGGILPNYFDTHQYERLHLDNVCDSLLPFSEGTYFNECGDPTPDWRTAFWGDNYQRLLAIKKEWDPTKVFDCHQCVGEEWLPY